VSPTARRRTRSASIRERLDHPVVDADGHYIESAPVFKRFLYDYVKDTAGGDLAARFDRAGGMDYDEMVLRPWAELSWEQRRAGWHTRPPWWTHPTRNTLDRATAQLPRLMYERLDEFGIDFSVLYGSRTLTTTAIKDDEVRQVACRALNAYHRDLYSDFQDRMTPAAQIPTHSPEEAIAELDHAVGELGFRAIMINGLVHRPIVAQDSASDPSQPNWGSGSGDRIDTLALDSAYDYDPFWQRCIDLGVSPASHTPGMGWGSRRSVSSYMYNHIGSFGASMDAFCKSVFFGGVTHRFPRLVVGLLEGGVGWACSLFADILGHWQKRNRETIAHLDPAALDVDELMRLYAEYGSERMQAQASELRDFFSKLEPEPPFLDEWEAIGIADEADIRARFEPHFYFGCEADDPMVSWAFDAKVNPLGTKLRAMFSSDMGHWDVADMGGILGEAYELVEKELIDETDFRDFVFTNPVRFYTALNPGFFDGTAIESEARELVASE
jgi:predicted TIM-barrel fold metal-dependent hydrolase